MSDILPIQRKHTKADKQPFDEVTWEVREALIGSPDKPAFKQSGVEFPSFWSQNSTNIVSDKYFRGKGKEKENSVKQMLGRITGWYTMVADKDGYFAAMDEVDTFNDELLHLLLHQRGAFNSPVQFNVGRTGDKPPRVSACFTLSVEDSIESILNWCVEEGLVFKSGSGAGINLSSLREAGALLKDGGVSSGPVSFMRGADASAGTIKSGGAARRAAKLVVLNVDHPDIEEYIDCKVIAEMAAHALKAAGFEVGLGGKDNYLLHYQNANNSVGLYDEFLKSCGEVDDSWNLISVVDKKVVKTVSARKILRKIAQAAWECADPGIFYLDTMNLWHTSPETDKLDTTNPCQPGFATVLTPDGIKTFDDIDVGSIVWSGRQWTKVVNKVATGVKPVSRYITRTGSFVGTVDHKVFQHGMRVKASDAQMIDFVTGPVSDLEEDVVPIHQQHVMDGLLIGDGSVIVANGGANHYPVVYVGEKDHDYFDEPGLNKLFFDDKFDTKSYRVKTKITRDEVKRIHEREIPERYHHGSSRQVRGFLRGLFSANGSICGGRVTLKAVSLTLIRQVQEMLSSIGIPSYHTVNKPNEVEFSNGSYVCKQSYDINITAGKSEFRRLIGFIQKYKQDKLNEVCKSIGKIRKKSYEIVEVESMGYMPVYDITVDVSEHSYWTGGMLVSNCSEFVRNNSSCNLASLRLTKYLREDGTFDVEGFIYDVRLLITAMDASVSNAEYPTEKIRKNVHNYRELGLGYADLGALLMRLGQPYDSDGGRSWAAAITALMSGAAWLRSAELAKKLGPYPGWCSPKNQEAHLKVMQQHFDALDDVNWDIIPENMVQVIYLLWSNAISMGQENGYRNAQVSLIAPTGTISFMLDCDTTGIEPDFSLVKTKKLSGGGSMKIVNQCVPAALKSLGYSQEEIKDIVNDVELYGSPDYSSSFDPVHNNVFACAIGDNAIHYRGHLKMIAAVQPFLCGSASKTYNMPSNCTVEDIENIIMEGWKAGVKNLSVYRDGCKADQPLNAGKPSQQATTTITQARKKLPNKRKGETTSFHLGDFKGYVRTGNYPDNTLGEIFIDSAKEGSTMKGLLESLGISISLGLQYGIPLETYVRMFTGHSFPPNGPTNDEDIRFASSIVDYLFRRLAVDYLPLEVRKQLYVLTTSERGADLDNPKPITVSRIDPSAPLCPSCGVYMQRAGSCYTCTDCGRTSGCS